MRATRVNEIIDAILAGVRAQPEVEQVAVLDGGKYVSDYRDYIIFIGYRPNADEFITVSRTAPQGVRSNDSERVTVGWMVCAKDGNGDMKVARDRATEKLSSLERFVTENQKLGLGGGVKAAMGQSVSWLTIHTNKGAECNIAGDVTVDVLL